MKTVALFGLIGLFTVALGQAPAHDPWTRRITVQSELDYVRAAKAPISIELKQVTIRQALDGVAAKAAFRVAYEGAIDGESKRDLTFRKVLVKEILGALGETFDLSYRVDAPDKLTVIGRPR